MKINTPQTQTSPSTQLRKAISGGSIILVAAWILAVTAQGAVGEESLPKGPALPVQNAKFHRFEKLRAGRIKTERGWNVTDFAMSVFNPSVTNKIKVTWTLIADDPNFIYRDGRKGTWTKECMLEPDHGFTDNVFSGAYLGAPWAVAEDSNWIGRSEFSSDAPFYAYILSFPVVEGPDSSKAGKKVELLWSDEVQGLWDEERKQFIFPYTNYWQNDPYWLGGWHTRLIVVNRSEAPVVYKISHRPVYWKKYSAFNTFKELPVKEEFAEVKLASGETRAVWLEDLFGWGKGSPEAMEGRLCVTPAPESAREKSEVKLYVLPDKVSVESLKEEERIALSEGTGIVVGAGRR